MKGKIRRKSKNQRKQQSSKLRRQITVEAAKLMYFGTESEYFTAKRKAARSFGVNSRYNPTDLPSNKEIREEILRQADLFEGDQRQDKLYEMRLYALSLMEKLEKFSPKLIGSTLTGHIREGSDIDLHIFSPSTSLVTQILENHGLPYDVERKRIVKFNEERLFTHIHVHGRFEVELTMYSPEYINYRFKSSITGKPMENVNLKSLRTLLEKEYPSIDLQQEVDNFDNNVESYEMFKFLLLPLEGLQGGPYHPEGDVLYHSLQVFDLARSNGYAYDIEFLQAALLHDVGKAIDPVYHAEAGSQALEGLVSERTLFLVRHHMDALKLQQGTLGQKKKRQLQQSEYYEDLLQLREFDNKGREPGIIVDELPEVLDYLKKLEKDLC